MKIYMTGSPFENIGVFLHKYMLASKTGSGLHIAYETSRAESDIRNIKNKRLFSASFFSCTVGLHTETLLTISDPYLLSFPQIDIEKMRREFWCSIVNIPINNCDIIIFTSYGFGDGVLARDSNLLKTVEIL